MARLRSLVHVETGADAVARAVKVVEADLCRRGGGRVKTGGGEGESSRGGRCGQLCIGRARVRVCVRSREGQSGRDGITQLFRGGEGQSLACQSADRANASRAIPGVPSGNSSIPRG
jgi:hypothetical protein